MKRLRIKMLSLGIASVVLLASTPAFAATNNTIKNSNKTSKNMVVKPNNIQMHLNFNYGPNGGPSAQSIINNGGVIQKGDIGYAVKQVQIAWNNWARQSGGTGSYLSVDGIFGQDTNNAIGSWQLNHGLRPDTIIGSATWAKLSQYL